jgi:drug/metabolite transporter (DMT)-like permease
MWFPLQLIAAFCWAGVNAFNSVIVLRHEKRPFVLQWHQSLFMSTFLAVVACFLSVQSPWAPWLALGGLIAYVGDIVYFKALDRIDVSVTNIAWALLSLFVSICSILLFHESWSIIQTAGVVLVLSAAAYLSLWHSRGNPSRHFPLLVLLALLNVPFYLIQKAALIDGVPILTVVFWCLAGREICAITIPLLIPTLRRQVLGAFRLHTIDFTMLNAFVVALYCTGVFFNAWAYGVGQLSLALIVSNVQPFIVLVIALTLAAFAPKLAAKEVLTKQSLRVKILCFLVVFAGLALIALPQ